ncbi:MAG: efflux RND transporter periplasmic adaptor subunit, partial [Phycisphaerales bacterium]
MSGKSPKKRVGNGVKGWLRRNAWKAVIVAIVIAAVLALGRLPEKDRQAPASPAPPVNVTVMTVTAEPNLADTFKLPAVVEPNRVVTVSAEFEGRIERIPCK